VGKVEETRNACQIFVEKTWTLSAWKNKEEMGYIKIRFKKLGSENKRWMVLAEDCIQ
jgi:hypothetical protein